MIKEIKYLVFIIIISIFFFFVLNYYFSDEHKKKSYRALNDINQKINLYSKNIPVLKNDTQNVIEYVKNTQSKNKRKFFFWKLIDKND